MGFALVTEKQKFMVRLDERFSLNKSKIIAISNSIFSTILRKQRDL